MGSKSNYLENTIVDLIFNAGTDAKLAANAGTLASLYLSLHTAAIDDTSAQNASECAYGGYGREAVARGTAGWTVTNNQAVLAANVDFGQCTSGTETATYFAIGTAASGATNVLYWGQISPTIAISAGVTPRLTTGTTISED